MTHKNIVFFLTFTIVLAVYWLVSCRDPYQAYLEEGEALSGGQTTIFDVSRNAFGQPAPGLEREQELLFFVGNSFFNQNWVSAPASTTARDGLGPLFNARSCASCHFKDGRGRAPEFAGEAPTGYLIRLSIANNGLDEPDPHYGGQLQDTALDGVAAEGSFEIIYEEIPFTFPDGEVVMLRKPTVTIDGLNYGDLDAEIMTSPRVGNQMIGLGLLEAVPEENLLALADPNDADGDGVSGRPNFVWDKVVEETVIGRFGWKANQPNLLQQTADAFHGDLGITTFVNPTENCTAVQTDCLATQNGGSPEIDDDDLLKVVLYASSLAVPARRNWDDPQVLEGKGLFIESGCSACHTPMLETAVHPTIPALSNQVIRPYSDLLLHDMGEGLADGRPDFEATGSEWRTQPLWGIGLIETVNGHTNYLHDGRARSLIEAILWHGGEAEQAKGNFVNLTPEQREAIIAFLKSL